MNVRGLFFERGTVGLAWLFFTGCATYDIEIDALARPVAESAEVGPAATEPRAVAGSYWIVSSNPAISADDLRFQEAAGCLRTALAAHGLWPAPTRQAAALVVELRYGLERKVRDVDVPQPVTGAFADQPELVAPNVEVDGSIRLSAESAAGRELDIYQHQARKVVSYEKHLSVVCRENAPLVPGRPPRQLWLVDAIIDDENRDLRSYLPILAAAVLVKMGQTTDGIDTTRIGARDDAVKLVEAGL